VIEEMREDVREHDEPTGKAHLAYAHAAQPRRSTWLAWHIWWWRIPIVNATLYAAAAMHFSLGLWALYQRRHFRYTVAEITQLLLGLRDVAPRPLARTSTTADACMVMISFCR
jgi:hypothetical protein